MELTLITESNRQSFEEMIFMENHTLGLPVISAGVVEDGYPIAAGSMEIDGTTGRIISLYTEESYRKKGAAALILKGFMDLAISLELTVMETDFVADEKGTYKLFASQNYEIFEGTEVNYISLDDALDSDHVMKFIKKAAPDVYVVSMDKYSDSRCRGILAALDVDTSRDELKGLSPDLSAFVLDHSNQPVGCVLVREFASDIIIDTFQVLDEKDEYAAALLCHLYDMLKTEKGTDIRIGFVVRGDHILEVACKVIGYNIEIEAGMKLYHAVKLIA